MEKDINKSTGWYGIYKENEKRNLPFHNRFVNEDVARDADLGWIKPKDRTIHAGAFWASHLIIIH
jgi:hypothetical protein